MNQAAPLIENCQFNHKTARMWGSHPRRERGWVGAR